MCEPRSPAPSAMTRPVAGRVASNRRLSDVRVPRGSDLSRGPNNPLTTSCDPRHSPLLVPRYTVIAKSQQQVIFTKGDYL
jgi:hypothetical protein